jgi:clathrin heavy chain
MTNVTDILEIREKCFEDELYQAAKLLFTSISNWDRLATTLIYLGENQAPTDLVFGPPSPAPRHR